MSEGNSRYLVEARALTKTYLTPASTVTVFEDLNWGIPRGRLVAVIGPSGKHPMSENDPRIIAFENDYEISKHWAEELVKPAQISLSRCFTIEVKRAADARILYVAWSRKDRGSTIAYLARISS